MSTIYDLNGKWDLIFDSTNVGMDQRWYANPPEETKEVEIPHTWEEEFGKYPGSVGFYYKKFAVDPNVNAKRCFLRFRRSFFHTTIWLNGKLVGENSGGHHPFMFNVAKAIKPGEVNMLCLRVASESANRIEGTHISELPVGLPFLENPFGGLWGDVELVNGGKGCVLSANVVPDMDNQKILVDVHFSNPRHYQSKVLFLLKGPGGAEVGRFEKEIKLEREDASIKLSLGVRDPQTWSPEKPNVYSLEIYLDKSFPVIKRFGFRKFDIYRHEFFLNDQPMKLMGAVYNLAHPVSGGVPENGESLRSDLINIKKAGFNVIRTGGSPLDDKTLDVCDDIGLMVWQEMPIHKQRSTKEGLEMSRALVAEIVNQQKSHPCIVVWVLGSENGTLMLENGTKLLKFVDELDNSRPVLSNINCVYLDSEGDFKKDTGKILGVTNERVQLYNSHRINTTMHMPAKLSRFCANYYQEDSSAVEVAESNFGNGDMANEYVDLMSEGNSRKVLVNLSVHTLLPDIKEILKKYGTAAKNYNHGKKLTSLNKALNAFFDKEFAGEGWKNTQEFVAALNRSSMIATLNRVDAFLSSTQVTGFFLDCWADTNTFFNGLRDEFRRTKGTEELIGLMTKTNRLLLSGVEYSPEANKPLPLQLRVLNGARLGMVHVGVYLHDNKGKNAFEWEGELDTMGSVFPVPLPEIVAPAQAGSWYLETVLKKDGVVLDNRKDELRVLSAPETEDILARPQVVVVGETTSPTQWENAKVVVVPRLGTLHPMQIEGLRDYAMAGGQVLLVQMEPSEVELIADWGLGEIQLLNTTGAKTSHFHYWLHSPCFAGFEGEPLADHYYAEVKPKFSWSGLKTESTHAHSFGITEEGELENFVDVAVCPVGQGRVMFHQYALLGGAPQGRILLDNALKTLLT